MRFNGVRVDTEKAKTLGMDLNKRKNNIIKGIKKLKLLTNLKDRDMILLLHQIELLKNL